MQLHAIELTAPRRIPTRQQALFPGMIERLRFTHTPPTYGGIYDDLIAPSSNDLNPTGPWICSLTPDGWHAPLLDCDRPVSTTRLIGSHDTMIVVRSAGAFDEHAVNIALTVLHQHDMLKDYGNPGVLGDITGPRRKLVHFALRRARRQYRTLYSEVAFKVPFPVVALPSRSRGHHHLFVEHKMTWDDAKTFADALSHAGIVDAHHSEISGKSGAFVLHRPYDPIR